MKQESKIIRDTIKNGIPIFNDLLEMLKKQKTAESFNKVLGMIREYAYQSTIHYLNKEEENV